MQPLYIPASDMIIRDPAYRYVHTNGEVYGRTDYEDPAKLAEIGAVQLVEVDDPHTDDMVQDGETLTVTASQATVTRKWRAATEAEVAAAKEAQVAMVKRQAAEALRESDWRMLRAIERFLVGELDSEGQEIAAEREAIREASDIAEEAVISAKSISEVRTSGTISISRNILTE